MGWEEGKATALAIAEKYKINAIPLVFRGKVPISAKGEQKRVLYESFDWSQFPPNTPINVGFVTGAVSGDLLVIDFDTEELARYFFKDFNEEIKSTMTVKTSRGYHFYHRASCTVQSTSVSFFRAGDFDERGKAKAWQTISLKSEGGYVVGPGSTHPSGSTYELISDCPPSIIEDPVSFLESLKKTAKKFAKDHEMSLEPPKMRNPEHTYDLKDYIEKLPSIESLISTKGYTKNGNELAGSHPFHGSTTGKNFAINVREQVWHCYRCWSGAGKLGFLAMKYGLADCKQAGKLSKVIIKELFDKVYEEFKIEAPSKEEEKKCTSFVIESDKIIEEIIDSVTKQPAFVVFNNDEGTFEIKSSIVQEEETIYPLPFDPGEERSVSLPGPPLEYWSVEELRKEMLQWALAEFDPGSNGLLFELIINIAMTSWVTEFQDGFGEKFLPIIQAIGPSETGKKRFLTIMRFLFYRPLYALKTTKVPSLFRALTKWGGTLILDEADLSDSSLAAELIQFYNSRADGVPITRYSTESGTNEWFYSFGYTVLAMRKPFSDDGAQSRCVPFGTEGTAHPDDYDLIPPKAWVEWGETLKQKLLMFRLRHLADPPEFPTQLIIEGVRSFRVRESVLMLYALKDEDPAMFESLATLLRELDRRLVSERANSLEGLILNIVYQWLTDNDGTVTQKANSWYITRPVTNKNGDENQVPLTLSTISDTLGKTLTPAEASRYWRGLGQDTISQLRIDGKRRRGLVVINKPERLQKEFYKYVVDAENTMQRFKKVIDLSDFKSDLQSIDSYDVSDSEIKDMIKENPNYRDRNPNSYDGIDMIEQPYD